MNEIVLGARTVLFPVPVEHVGRVAAFLDELGAGDRSLEEAATAGGEGPRQAGSVHVDESNGEWTEAMVETLASVLPYAGVAAVLDECAAEPGAWVSKATIETRAGVSPVQLRNELVALSKLTAKHLGRGTWPFSGKKELGAMHYRLHPQIAAWWIGARPAA